MTEPQYQRYKYLPPVELPPHARQLWLEDPKMLGIRLARYKFVAKMLAGKDFVAEIGCGDGFYSRIVEEHVSLLKLFDLDASFGGRVEKHDIVNDGPLPADILGDGPVPDKTAYDAIYSLDCFEHIDAENWDNALGNVRDSLLEGGVFILGMPSKESQQYASEASKAGHVNCLSHWELKEWLNLYFDNVFVFTMHDEQLGMSFGPMSHYLLAVCVGVRD